MLLSLLAGWQPAAASLLFAETADGRRSAGMRDLVRWTHTRLVFGQNLERIAVGQDETIQVELLNEREVLLLAKAVGRTSLMVWYADGTTEAFLFGVIEDLSVLKRALTDIHPKIRIELAPDRAALILRGTVPTVDYKIAAEAAARSYLGAGSSPRAALSSRGYDTPVLVQDANQQAGPDFRLDASARMEQPSTAIINLIQVERLPESLENKISGAIASLGGGEVEVRRVIYGDVADDTLDTFVLEGEVADQVALVRVLNVAARLVLGPGATGGVADVIEVIADEAGGLVEEREEEQFDAVRSIAGLSLSTGSSPDNQIEANLGRSKLLSVAGGRILSAIRVRDVPQVRVAVQIHEVNRSRLKSWRPDLTAVTGDYVATSPSADGTGMIVQPDGSQRIGADGWAVENALQVLGGALTNHFQVGGSDLAFDLLFSLMEEEGISRTLSRPTLTVLSGEPAVFQTGGEVPVPTAFAPSIGDGGVSTPGVFSGTQFRPFGVQLSVRPLVGEDNRITLDVNPSVVIPDTALTQAIASSTGTDPNTVAFNSRSLETSTRIRDGQPLVIGGLISRRLGDSNTYTPGVHQTPLFGWLVKSYDKSDDDIELVIIVTPTIVREPQENVALWQYPSPYELMLTSVGMPGPDALPPELDPTASALEGANSENGIGGIH